MADDPTVEPAGDLAGVEAMLRELRTSDLEFVDPPVVVWAGIEQAVTEVEVPSAPVTRIPSKRHRFVRPLIGIAAALILVVVGIGIIASRNDRDVLATAKLTFDPASFDPLGEGSSATVSLVKSRSGKEIVIDTASLPTDLSDEDLEMWLIEADTSGKILDLVPLGIVDPTRHGTFDVPKGYDTSRYSVVDISVEPRDGNPAHSSRSILRGSLFKAE